MPARDYMVVDRRHDHSFRIPRPDLSAKFGTPNACNYCHADKSQEWAAITIGNWHGPDRLGFQKYAQAFHAAWTDQPNAEALLAAVASDHDAPAFARASALSELAPHVSPANLNLAKSGLSDPDPTVRIAALDMLDGVPPSQIWPLVSPLLADSSRGVRIRAAALLAAVPAASQLRQTARNLSSLRPISWPLSASTLTDPNHAPRSETSMHGAATPQMPRPNTRPGSY